MEFQEKKYVFSGIDGCAGFRHGTEYELEFKKVATTEERAAHVIVVNPVSKLRGYYTAAEFAEVWEKE